MIEYLPLLTSSPVASHWRPITSNQSSASVSSLLRVVILKPPAVAKSLRETDSRQVCSLLMEDRGKSGKTLRYKVEWSERRDEEGSERKAFVHKRCFHTGLPPWGHCVKGLESRRKGLEIVFILHS